jgi:peptide/nickel transport system substrate-binding protein
MRTTLVRCLVCGVLWALLAGCTPGGRDDTPRARPPPNADPTGAGSETVSTVEGGTVVVAVDEEPATLNPWITDGDGVAGMITRPMLAPLWRVHPDGTSEPWLLAGEPVAQGDGDSEPFTVTYRIRDEAVWSDGEPIDGDDVLFTLQTCREVTRDETCAAVDLDASSAEGKHVTVAFERPVAAWRTLMSSLPVLPEHELRGRDPHTTWTRQATVSSGPFRFARWTPGERLVLERNERWWGEPAQLERIEFRFVDGMAVTELGAGAADVAQMTATPDVVDQVRAHPDLQASVAAGRRWVALDFNGATPQLQSPLVRRALAQAIDRATIVAELVAPVDSGADVLDELPGGPAAAESDGPLFPTHDINAARRALDAAGCASGDDGVRRCGGEPLELDLLTATEESAEAGSTDEDADLRTEFQLDIVGEYVQSQLAEIGVAVRRMDPPAASASEPPSQPTGNATWDLRITSVTTAPDAAIGDGRWRCDDAANTQSFCHPRFDTLTQQAAETVGRGARADLEAQAAALLSNALPTYPLYELPELLVHARTVRGPVLNAGPWGSTWNIEEWARTAS